MIENRSPFEVRIAKSCDSAAVMSVFAESWRNAYTGILPGPYISQSIQRRGPRWWDRAIRSEEHFLVLEFGGDVVGYATCGRARTMRRRCGEIYELYVAPIYQGIGLGQHLFEACRHRLDHDGHDGLIVWALAENDQANEFYWHRGGRPIARSRDNCGGKVVEKIAFGWN